MVHDIPIKLLYSPSHSYLSAHRDASAKGYAFVGICVRQMKLLTQFVNVESLELQLTCKGHHYYPIFSKLDLFASVF